MMSITTEDLIKISGRRGNTLPRKPLEEKIDETDTLSSVSSDIYNYLSTQSKTFKHDKKLCNEIFIMIKRIIEPFEFSNKQDLIDLWEIYLFQRIPSRFESKDLSKVSAELIQKINTKIIKVVRDEINILIRTPSKIENVIKRILQADTRVEFFNLFEIDVESLQSKEKLVYQNMQKHDVEYTEALDFLLGSIEFNKSEDDLITQLYVSLIHI